MEQEDRRDRRRARHGRSGGDDELAVPEVAATCRSTASSRRSRPTSRRRSGGRCGRDLHDGVLDGERWRGGHVRRRLKQFAEWIKDQPGVGTMRLVRDLSDPAKFISFADWDGIEEIHRWKGTPEFRERSGASSSTRTRSADRGRAHGEGREGRGRHLGRGYTSSFSSSRASRHRPSGSRRQTMRKRRRTLRVSELSGPLSQLARPRTAAKLPSNTANE